MSGIDFVLTWVDGNDPEWQKTRAEYDTERASGNKASHYRDYGTLKYWFRAVEKFAPWVDKIHFVTCGQKPEWLNEENPKLRLVSHSDYMPCEYVPTFSANPIELNFHRIEGLAEKFVYFNDDTFLSAPTKSTDFFKGDLPCDNAIMSALTPSVKNEVITYILFNDLMLLNSNFSKRASIRKNRRKWYSLKYGKGVLRNLYYSFIGKFSGFIDPHLPNSFLKSTFSEVWEKEGEYLDKVCKNRFRTKEDVNQYLMRYWRLAKGEFSPRSPKIGKCYTLGADNDAIESAVKNKKYKMLCINDNSQMSDIDSHMNWLVSVFEELFPDKSSFEK